MEEQVLKNLIELYKARGVSLDNLLVNPMFANLPVQAKIKLIKKYSEELHSGIRFDKGDALNLLKVVGAGLGAYGVYRLGSKVMEKVINVPNDATQDQIEASATRAVSIAAPLMLAAVPTTAILYNSFTSAMDTMGRKKAIKGYLKSVKSNPNSNNSAIKLLAFAHDTIKD